MAKTLSFQFSLSLALVSLQNLQFHFFRFLVAFRFILNPNNDDNVKDDNNNNKSTNNSKIKSQKRS